MTSFRPKLWTGLSAVALLAATGLAACGEKGDSATPAAAVGEGGEGGAESGAAAADASVQAAYNAVPAESRAALRLAHLRGYFLVAGLQTEGADYGAVLIGQGMRDVFDIQPEAIRATGVDEAVLKTALETGAPTDIGAALATIDAAIKRSGGDQAAIAKGLVTIAASLYGGAVQTTGVDAAEYQHSMGAVLSAQQLAKDSADAKLTAAQGDIDALAKMWPSVEAPTTPTPVADVAAQVSRIELALS